METRINVAELLRNSPSDMELGCAMFENLYFDYIDDSLNNPYPIFCYWKTNEAQNVVRFSKYGTFTLHPNAKCVIFPKGKDTWKGFVPPCKVKDGDITKYPKTYEESCDVLGFHYSLFDIDCIKTHNPSYDYLLKNFYQLLTCRNAYWKFYSEQMRLGDPWCPDYEIDEDGTGTVKFCIKNMGGKIKMVETAESNTILAFPTTKMRNDFYENFKELIEKSKELL